MLVLIGDSSLPPGEYDAKSLLVDQIEAAVSFAMDKLFLHYEIYQFTSFFNNTLELVGERLQDSQALPTHPQALKHFETSLVPHYSNRITEHNFLEAVGYIKETIFHHFHLYQFLLTHEQPIDLITLYRPIEVLPAEPLPLVQGIEEEEWNRREKIGQLEVEHTLKEMELIEYQRKTQVELKEKLKNAYQTELAKIDETEDELVTPEGVAEVIESLLTAHIELMKSTVTHAMQTQELALNTRLEKVEMLSNKPNEHLLSPSPKKGAVSPGGKKSRNSSRLSVSNAAS